MKKTFLKELSTKRALENFSNVIFKKRLLLSIFFILISIAIVIFSLGVPNQTGCGEGVNNTVEDTGQDEYADNDGVDEEGDKNDIEDGEDQEDFKGKGLTYRSTKDVFVLKEGGQADVDEGGPDSLYRFLIDEYPYLLLNTLITPETTQFLKFLDKIAVVNASVLNAILKNKRFYLFTQGETPAELLASLADNNISGDELMQMHNIEAWCALTPQSQTNGYSGLSQQLGCDVKGPSIMGMSGGNPFRAFMSGPCPGGGSGGDGGSSGSAEPGTAGVGGDCGSGSAAEEMANIASANRSRKSGSAAKMEGRLKDRLCDANDGNVSVNYVNPAQGRLQQASEGGGANNGVDEKDPKSTIGGSKLGSEKNIPANKPGGFLGLIRSLVEGRARDQASKGTPGGGKKNPGENDVGGARVTFTAPDDPTYDPMGDMALGALQLFAISRHMSAQIGGAIDPSPDGVGGSAGQVFFDPCNGRMWGGGMTRLTMSDVQQNAMASPCSRSNPGETGANLCIGGSSSILGDFFRGFFCENNPNSPLCKSGETRIGAGRPPKSREAEQLQKATSGRKEASKAGTVMRSSGTTPAAATGGTVERRSPSSSVPAVDKSIIQQKTPASTKQRGTPNSPWKK